MKPNLSRRQFARNLAANLIGAYFGLISAVFSSSLSRFITIEVGRGNLKRASQVFNTAPWASCALAAVVPLAGVGASLNVEAGASRELVKDGTSGLLFRDGDVPQLAGHFDGLIRNRERLNRLRRAAWERLGSGWRPRVAAERLITLCEGLSTGSSPVYEDGP